MARYSVVVYDHIRYIFFKEPCKPHCFGMYGILAEMVMIEFLSDRIESCHMELPIRMLLLEFVMDSSAVGILHGNQNQIQLPGKVPVDIFRQ